MAEHSTRSLKILEAYTRDVGRGAARIDYDSMDSIGASDGDIIELRGKRRTVAKCSPLDPSDEGKGILRVDGLVRNNAGVAIGDTVVVRKIKAVPAEKVIVAPLEAIPPIDERYIPGALESLPVIKGDNVMVPYFGGRLTFQVVGVSPAADAVLITQETIFHIAEKAETVRPQATYEDIGEIKFGIEYGIRSETEKTFLIVKFILSHFGAEQVGYFEKQLEQDQVKEMFVNYRNAAEEVLADANELLADVNEQLNLNEQKNIDVNLADIVCAILDRCRSIKD